jgi:glycosyltransferase involved in cell wall biosynthesis
MPQSISVIIPARNEEKNLPSSIASIMQAYRALNDTTSTLEIVVVCNRCTDKTAEVAQSLGCIALHEEGKNLAAIRNAGVRASTGSIVITIDADSLMSKKMLCEVIRYMSNERVVGGGVLILPERYSLGILLTMACLLPIVLSYRISCGMFFVRRVDFDAIGGFDERWITVEDIDFAKRLRNHGLQTSRSYKTIWRAWITTSMRKFDTFGDWYFITHPRMFLRILRGDSQELGDKVWYDFKR